MFGPKNFLKQIKNLIQKKFLEEDFWPEKISNPKKNFGLKKFWSEKKYFVQKNFWSQKFLWTGNNLGQQILYLDSERPTITP